jgi:hypothetical protein
MPQPIEMIGGIDTHTDAHQAAVDTIGRHLATEAFPTTPEKASAYRSVGVVSRTGFWIG